LPYYNKAQLYNLLFADTNVIAMTAHKEPPFFFSVKHIIKPLSSQLIYVIRFNDLDYFLIKTPGISDCEQLDNQPRFDINILTRICQVISKIERDYKKTPPLEYINMDIFNILAQNNI
jgi:hypothetical protein